MDWATATSIAAGALGAVASAHKLAGGWRAKAVAEGARAEAERQKGKEVEELRASHGRFMARMEQAEHEIIRVEGKVDRLRIRIQERARADTRGVPIPPPEDEDDSH